MPDSQQIVKRFSMRIYLQDRQGRVGIAPVFKSNQLLKTIMEELVRSDQDASQEDWVRYFLKLLIEYPKICHIFVFTTSFSWLIKVYPSFLKISQELLFNYLQPICWQAAIKINYSFKASKNINLHYPIEECFIIASVASYQAAQIFRRFDFKSSSSIDAYFFKSLKRIIKNQIAKELKSKSIKFSDNGLLRTLEKKQLEKALTEYGLKSKQIELSCLAWQSFKDLFEEIYPSTSDDGSRRKNYPTTPLNEQQLSQIAIRYNERLRRLGINAQPADSQKLQKMLARCIQAVRNSQQICSVSLENHGTGEINDLVSNPFEMVIKEEERNELTQIKRIILQEFKALDTLAQKSLLLWLGLGINQEDFPFLLNLEKQYQVARKFQSHQKTILKAVVKLSFQQSLNKNISEKEVNQIVKNHLNYLKEYLKTYSQTYFREILDKILTKQTSMKERTILRNYLTQYYEYNKTRNKSNKITNYSLNIESNYLNIKHKTKIIFIKYLEKELQIDLQQFNSVDKQIANFIESYLQDNTAILY